MQGGHGHLSREQKRLALRLHAKGWRLVDIAREIGCSAPMVGIMSRTGQHVDAKPLGWEPRPGQLTIHEREQILLGINRGDTFTAISLLLGRAVSTVSRKVKRGGGRAGYSAWHAHERAREHARRPKPFKLAQGRLLDGVCCRLKQLWSPQEVVVRIRLDHADDHGVALVVDQDDHLGSGLRDVQARRVHHGHGHPDLLLRSPLAVAAR